MMNTDQNLGLPPAEVEAFVAEFFEQMEPKVRKGGAWTFHPRLPREIRLSGDCSSPLPAPFVCSC